MFAGRTSCAIPMSVEQLASPRRLRGEHDWYELVAIVR